MHEQERTMSYKMQGVGAGRSEPMQVTAFGIFPHVTIFRTWHLCPIAV